MQSCRISSITGPNKLVFSLAILEYGNMLYSVMLSYSGTDTGTLLFALCQLGLAQAPRWTDGGRDIYHIGESGVSPASFKAKA